MNAHEALILRMIECRRARDRLWANPPADFGVASLLDHGLRVAERELEIVADLLTPGCYRWRAQFAEQLRAAKRAPDWLHHVLQRDSGGGRERHMAGVV